MACFLGKSIASNLIFIRRSKLISIMNGLGRWRVHARPLQYWQLSGLAEA